MAANFVAALAMMGSCVVIAALLWCGRAPLLNIVIAFYVFRVYLTRPYITLFQSRLYGDDLEYIRSSEWYFNSSDAAVVYLGLLSLLVAWLLGLVIAAPKHTQAVARPWIFRQVDAGVTRSVWLFLIVWALLWVLNLSSPVESWQGIATGEGKASFAFGLLATRTIEIVGVYSFLRSRGFGARSAPLMLLAPALWSAIYDTGFGSRGAVFTTVVLAALYWLFLIYDKRVGRYLLPTSIVSALLFPVVMFSGLLAQSLRPLLRVGSDAETVWRATLDGLDVSDPNNPIMSSIYFGLTQLIHRLSNIKTQFLILNDHFVHEPWETYNPVWTLMRTVNDLVPGTVFPNMLTINQLFAYIYEGNLVTYSSDTWSIQGTLYLYWGLWLSPLVVFLVALWVGRHSRSLTALARESPAFAAFFVLLVRAVIEFGTIERVVPVNVVRPLAGFLGFIFLVGLVRAILPAKRRLRLAARQSIVRTT